MSKVHHINCLTCSGTQSQIIKGNVALANRKIENLMSTSDASELYICILMAYMHNNWVLQLGCYWATTSQCESSRRITYLSQSHSLL